MTREEKRQQQNMIMPRATEARVILELVDTEVNYLGNSALMIPEGLEGTGDQTRKTILIAMGPLAKEKNPDLELGDIVLRPQGSGHVFKMNGKEYHSCYHGECIAFFKKDEWEKYIKSFKKAKPMKSVDVEVDKDDDDN